MLTKKILIFGIFAKKHLVFVSVRASEGHSCPVAYPAPSGRLVKSLGLVLS